MSLRVCVLGSGSKGNSTLVATEKTRVLVDAGLNRRETYARLAAVGERTDGFDAILISHEHVDHINGLRLLGIDWKATNLHYASHPRGDFVGPQTLRL